MQAVNACQHRPKQGHQRGANNPVCACEGCKRLRPVGKSRYCFSCQYRRKRERNPIAFAYGLLRRHARERGKSFTISLAYFEAFCHATQYHTGAGRTVNALTVDRIDTTKGYEPGNLQVLSNAANVRKYWNYEYCYYAQRMVFYQRNASNDLSGSDCPF